MAQFAVDLPRVEDRNNPSAEFIRSLRRRYPVEREIDRVLTRKMERRAISRYSPVSLSDLEEGARKLIGARYGGRFQLSNSRWLTGGASKLQVVFDLEWRGLEVGETRVTRMVLRVEPPESVVETSRNREFEVIRAVGNLVPVPPCYWIDDDATFLPYPALIYGFAAGSAKPSKVSSEQITGIGLNYGPELRPKLGLQFLEGMGRFHNVDQATIDKMPSLELPSVGTSEGIVRQLNWWRRVWEEDRYEDEPLMEAAYRWLVINAPAIDHMSLVHGDCRNGNILFTEHDAKITAWLDWELAVLGDRHQDIAWSMMDIYRHSSEDGRDILVSGFFPEQQYLELYEKISGLSVDRKRLKYFRAMCSYMGVVMCQATANRVANEGKTHQDVLSSWMAMLGPNMFEQLRSTLWEIA